MKHLRLSLPVLALALAGTWANQATACDKDKATAATASTAAHAACSAEMAAACTPEMAAACKANKSTKTSAVTAASTAASTGSKSASMDCCATKSAKTAVASRDAKATKTTAVAASEAGCMGMMDVALVTAAAGHGSCATGTKTTAVVAGSGGQCSSKSSSTATRTAHGECDACADMLLCNGELETAGTRTQVVPLKNGVMFVYTAEEPGSVNAVQSAMARRSQRLSQIVTAGDRAQLCADCKMMRGAIASGKMTREVINIEGGALTLMTSTDPAMVKKIRSLVDGNKVARAKS